MIDAITWTWDALNGEDAKAKAAGILLGRYITHPYADGRAVYRITGETSRKVTISHVEIDDAWVLPAWGYSKTLNKSEVLSFVQYRDRLAAVAASKASWWDQQVIGTIIHYHNGFGEFVRGTIIEEAGKKTMQPIALVGNWKHQNDLWTRRADGTIAYGYHVRGIQDRHTWRPDTGCIFEHPNFSRPGMAIDPTVLTPLEIEPPTA